MDVILDGIDENLHECDLIFLYTPVEYNTGYLSIIRLCLRQGVLITGVGSARCGIHEEIRRQGLEYCFVGDRPMAGSKKTDYEGSTDHLLENAYYVTTPPEGKNSSCPQALSLNAERITAVAKTTGTIPPALDYRERDKVVATISHLPHLVTSSLMNLVKNHDTADGTTKQVAADGFKGVTRIASSSPEIQEQIYMTNVAPISGILEACIVSLNKVLKEVKEHKGQDIYRLFETSRDYRNSITDKARGSVEPFYEFIVGISNEVGAISAISVILAAKGTSIKNIGINDNRERGEGALKIALYSEASMEAAWQRLDRYKCEMFRM